MSKNNQFKYWESFFIILRNFLKALNYHRSDIKAIKHFGRQAKK